MLVIESKGAKGKSFDKKKLKSYWRRVYPKKYTDVLVGRKLVHINKEASERLKSVTLKGTLRQRDNGFLYLDISNNVIHGMYSLIDEEDIDKPPYFGDGEVGAHVSVAYEEEVEDLEIKEIGKEYNFKLGKFYSTNPEGWDKMERVWFVEVVAPELEKLRKKYGLSKLLNGHKFHITVAVRRNK